MKHFQIGRDGLGKLYKALAEDELDRIVGDRISLPSPYHDRINMAHARMCALVSQNGHLPSRNRALQLMQAAGLGTDEIMDVIQTMDVYADHPVITDGKLAVHLQQLGVPVTAENLTRARPVGAAAMTDACLAATVEANPGAAIHLGLPLPTAVGYFGQLGIAARSGGAPLTNSVEKPAVVPPSLSTLGGIDGPFGEVAEAVIKRKMQEAQWDESRAREVRASVALFIHENGDLAFSTVQQHHLFEWTGLMNRLPKRYNHFMVKGQGGFVAALAAAAIIRASTVEGETAEQKKQRVAKLIGLHSGTRNKHISWLKAIIEGARGAGYTKLSLDFTSLRHGAKQVRKTDKRKKHEKRPNWTVGAYARLTSGPIYDGCAGIDDRFTPGNIVLQDAVYWAPHVVLNFCGRPGEAALELNDVFEDAPIPYFYVRPNGLRGLKVEGGERMVPIHPKLIELGFLNYVRALRAAGHTRLFPEFVHPEGKLDFAWMMRNKILEPAKKLHFPEGTGLEMHGKSPDGHSLRGTGRTALRDSGVEEPMRNYISGHTQGTVGVEVYETPPPLELVMKAVRALDPFFAHLQQRPLHLRPSDRMKFGAKRGRPRERS